MTESERTADEHLAEVDPRTRPGRLGLSPNLWRVAAVIAIAQFSTSLWKWEFGIFLEETLLFEPWQLGVVFSVATLTGLLSSGFAGYIADFIGRRWTIAMGFIPVTIGLITLSYFPIWPIVPIQYGLVWFGMSTARLMARAMPADEIAADDGSYPARRLMMVMMPLWFVDAFGPLVGTFLLSRGFQSGDLHLIGAFASILSFVSAVVLINESLGSEVIKKARAGPKIAFRRLGREFWLVTFAMLGMYFCWTSSTPYLGNLSVGWWNVDDITYGLTWSLFSLTAALAMYPASTFADRNLKRALLTGVIGNGFIFIWFSFGSGALMMYAINFFWAIPFVLWIGAERSIIVLSVSKETKGRALGTYDFLMGVFAIFGQLFGALIWELSDSLRVVYFVAGIGMLLSSILLFVVLRHIHLANKQKAEYL